MKLCSDIRIQYVFMQYLDHAQIFRLASLPNNHNLGSWHLFTFCSLQRIAQFQKVNPLRPLERFCFASSTILVNNSSTQFTLSGSNIEFVLIPGTGFFISIDMAYPLLSHWRMMIHCPSAAAATTKGHSINS